MSQSGVQEVVRSFIVEEGDRVADKDWGAGLLIRIGVRARPAILSIFKTT